MDKEKIFGEARANIIWGDSLSTVREFLDSNGISQEETEAKIAEFAEERRREVRAIAVRRVLFGVLSMIVSAGAFYVSQNDSEYRLRKSGRYLIGFALIAGHLGLWKVVGGLSLLAFKEDKGRAISDIDE